MTSGALSFVSEGIQCELGQEAYRNCVNIAKDDTETSNLHASLPLQPHDVHVKIEPGLCSNTDVEEHADSSLPGCASYLQVDYVCKICDERFSIQEDFKKHHLTHHREGTPFKCYKCSKTFRCWLGNNGLKVHLETHLESVGHQHNEDSEVGCTFGDLRDNKFLVDSNTLRLKSFNDIEFCEGVCGDCGVQYPSTIIYETHCKAHNSDEPFKCIECSLRFKKRVHLEEHRASHLLVKLYSCKECGKEYSFKWSLLMHSKTHGVQPQHQCTKCGLEFFNLNFLSSHEHLHELQIDGQGIELKPLDLMDVGLHLCKFHFDQVHPCPICDEEKNGECSKAVSPVEMDCEDCDLLQHLQLHKNPQAFKCEECEKVCGSFVRLQEHVYASHGDLEVHWCEDCGGSGYMNILSNEESWPRDGDHDSWSSRMGNEDVTQGIEGLDNSLICSLEELSEDENYSFKKCGRTKMPNEAGQLKNQCIPADTNSKRKRPAFSDKDKPKRKILEAPTKLKLDRTAKSKKGTALKSKRGARQHSKKK